MGGWGWVSNFGMCMGGIAAVWVVCPRPLARNLLSARSQRAPSNEFGDIRFLEDPTAADGWAER